MSITLKDSTETEQLACDMGKKLRGGECFELTSDLGGGKTTFTRGLARGIGSTDIVASPTFTISKRYQAGNKTIYHYDFYRLDEPGLVAEELAEGLEDEQGITVIEWAKGLKDVLPEERVKIRIDKSAVREDWREIQLSYSDNLQYLFEVES